jgi:hypothetical protein
MIRAHSIFLEESDTHLDPKSKINVNYDDLILDQSTFQIAIENGDIPTLMKFLASPEAMQTIDFNQNFGSDQQNALHVAANDNYNEMVRVFIRKAGDKLNLNA